MKTLKFLHKDAEIDVLCAITDYIFAKSKILFQVRLDKEKKKWEVILRQYLYTG